MVTSNVSQENSGLWLARSFFETALPPPTTILAFFQLGGNWLKITHQLIFLVLFRQPPSMQNYGIRQMIDGRLNRIIFTVFVPKKTIRCL